MTRQAIRKFLTNFVDSVVSNRKYGRCVEDIRNCQPTEPESCQLWGDSNGADDAVMAMIMRDRYYDVSTGYTLPCIDYSDITDSDTPDDAVDYYWIKVIGRYYLPGNPYAAPEMRAFTPKGSYSQGYIELNMHVCLDYEYALDEHWSGGKAASFVRGRWVKRIPLKTDRAPRHNMQRLAEEAIKGFGNAA